MRDPAFIDRIHGVVPGWEVPKVGKADVYISKHLGFVTDYFSEILHGMRGKLDFFYLVRNRVELSNVNFRDERAILKLASAFLKLTTPDSAIIGEQDLKLAIDLAVEYRQRIADWLHFLAPGEFEKKKIGYRIKV